MRKVHSKVIVAFLATENIRTPNFSVQNVIRDGKLYSVLYSYALPVAIKESNSEFGKFYIGNYIRQISATTSAQIRAVVTTLNTLGLKYEMMSIKDFEKFVTETI